MTDGSEDIHWLRYAAAYGIDYQWYIEKQECCDVEIREEDSAETNVALVTACVFFPAEEIEHQWESDDDVYYWEAFVFNHETEEEQYECEIRQHIRSQSGKYVDSVAASGAAHETEGVVAVRKRVGWLGVELIDFSSQEESADEHVSAFVRHRLHDVDVFSEKEFMENEINDKADAHP